MGQIKYAVVTPGGENRFTRTIDDAPDRAEWNPGIANGVALMHAQKHIEPTLSAADVTVIRMGEPHDQYDEEGSTGGSL